MSTESSVPNFEPYQVFNANQKSIDDFMQLTVLAYGIGLQLISHDSGHNESNLVIPATPEKADSYSMADTFVKSVVERAGWVTFSEYSEKAGEALDIVIHQAEDGKLGHVLRHPKTGENIVIWPPEMQSVPLSELPEPGKKVFSVKIEQRRSRSIGLDLDSKDKFEDIQRTLLQLAHAIGEPNTVVERSLEQLYRSCFLLEWTIFEEFLRATVRDMIKRHPQKLFSSKQKETISYGEILEMTQNFVSAEKLRDELVEREIEKQKGRSDSITGVINFLKSNFHFKHDPYQAWYVLDGVEYRANYNDMEEFREIRNVFIHQGGRPTEEFIARFPNLPIRDNTITVGDDYYHKVRLALRSIAFSMALSIERRQYETET